MFLFRLVSRLHDSLTFRVLVLLHRCFMMFHRVDKADLDLFKLFLNGSFSRWIDVRCSNVVHKFFEPVVKHTKLLQFLHLIVILDEGVNCSIRHIDETR